MWVQEGNDCKETDAAYYRGTSLFSRQTVTTMAIPMHVPATKRFELERKFNINVDDDDVDDDVDVNSTHKNKNENQNSFMLSDHKEQSPAPEEREVNVDFTTPTKPIQPSISPAQFLKSLIKNKRDNVSMELDFNDDANIHTDMFETDDYGGCHVDDDDDGDDVNGEDVNGDDVSFFDLKIIGKKLKVLSVDNAYDNNVTHKIDGDDDMYRRAGEEEKEKEQEKCLDIKYSHQWDKYLNFSKNNDGLLVIEIYSAIFGASDIMYPFIVEIIGKNGNNKTKFVRLNLYKLQEIKEIREIITNYLDYKPTPIPIYIFIKNGQKVHELRGTKLQTFKQIISKYSKIETSDNNKENRPNRSHSTEYIENIQNLIKMSHDTPKSTKLSTGTIAQAMWR